MSDYVNWRCGRTVGQGSTCDLPSGHVSGCAEDWGPSMTPAANAAVRARGGRGADDPAGLQAEPVPILRFEGPLTLGERIDKVLALHKLNPLANGLDDGYFNHDAICVECGDDYPCKTVRILRGES